MSQEHNIIAALNAVAKTNPMAADLASAGFVGGLHQGTDAQRDAPKPFGLLTAERVGGVHNGPTELVTYTITLQVIVGENVAVTGQILEVFEAYWSQAFLRDNIDLTDTLADFVLIHPGLGEQGELEQQELGKDIMSGVKTWTLKLQEHQPVLE